MKITTSRMILLSFTPELIHAALENSAASYAGMGIVPNPEWPEPDLVEALPHFRGLLLEHGATGYNSWLMLDGVSREIIGSLGFLGEPDASGSLEMGFGVVPGRRLQGYCSEAVGALVEWAASQQGVRRITAQCAVDNHVSRRVLLKTGFAEGPAEDGLAQWEWLVND